MSETKKLKPEDEKGAINTVLAFGAQYGYGNLISHLQNEWVERLISKHGFDQETAELTAWKLSAIQHWVECEQAVHIAALKAEVERLRRMNKKRAEALRQADEALKAMGKNQLESGTQNSELGEEE